MSNCSFRSKAAAVLAFACLAFVPGAWAQQGFFVYQGKEKNKNSGLTYVEVVPVTCKGFSAGATTTTCSKVDTKTVKPPYNFGELPSVLLFGTGYSFCYYDPARQTWVCI